jgi:hypothetical protein
MTGCRESVRRLEPWIEHGIGASKRWTMPSDPDDLPPMTGEQKFLFIFIVPFCIALGMILTIYVLVSLP